MSTMIAPLDVSALGSGAVDQGQPACPSVREVSVDPTGPLIARWGTSSTSPLVGGSGTDLIALCGDAATAGMQRVGRWAVTLGDVIGPPAVLDAARREYVEFVTR